MKSRQNAETYLNSNIKGVIWCDIKFSFVFGVLQAGHAYIRSAKLQRLKSQSQDSSTPS